MTEQEAKEIYLKSDCSYFIMCTNYYSSYVEYRRMALPKEQERVWKLERIQTLYLEMRKTGNYRLFDRIYEIAIEFRDYKHLIILYESLQCITEPLTPNASLDVAETILGKKHIKFRSGVIYWAYDNGQKGLALLFMDQALELIYHPEETDAKIQSRIRQLRRLCKRIIKDLKLNFSKQYLMHYYNF